MSAPRYSEQEVLLMLKADSKEAFTQVYEQYSRSLYLNLVKLVKLESVAEEILQDTFVSIWEKRATLSVESNLGGYLFRTAQHKAHDFFRKLKREEKLREYIIQASAGEFDYIDKGILHQEEFALLSVAIQKLPPQRRQVFQLCKLEGRSYQEVSSMLGISPSTVNDHIVKATRFVRDFMLADDRLTIACLPVMLFLYC